MPKKTLPSKPDTIPSLSELVDTSTGEIIPYDPPTRVCSICGVEKENKYFYKHKVRGYEANCKQCKPLLAREKQQHEQQVIRTITSKLDEALPLRESDNEAFVTFVRPHVESLVTELITIAHESEKDAERIKAITYLLDRVLGKPDQTVTVKNSDVSKAEAFLTLWDTMEDVTPQPDVIGMEVSDGESY